MRLSKGLILSAAGALVLFLQGMGLKIDAPIVNEIIEAVCGVLVVLGIISAAQPPQEKTDLLDDYQPDQSTDTDKEADRETDKDNQNENQ